MPDLERFEVLAPLPPRGGWRRVVAVDRSGAPRPVVLAFAPPSLIDDAGRLAAVLRDAEAAGRLNHPGAVPVLGTETVDDALAVVEEYRAGTTLRELLDAGGRLPADVAVRLALDTCAALTAAHGIDAGAGRALCHGAIDPERILVEDGGAALLCGFGTAGGGTVEADVRAVASALYEALAGEPPGDPARPIDAPGLPAGLTGAVERALGARQGGPFPSADAFARAIAGTGPAASHRSVASYADAILPAGEGMRAALRGTIARGLRGTGFAEEVSAELVVEPTDPTIPSPRTIGISESAPLLRPPSTRPGADPAGIFRAPLSARRASRLPLVVLVCATAGFGIGLAGARFGLTGPAAPPAALEESEEGAAPAPASAAPPAEAPAAAAPPSVRAVKVRVPRAPRPRPAVGKGVLDVTAPAEAEVFLDGRRIGAGSVRLEVSEGPHRIEVRHGPNRVEERFTVAPGETWTYAVTPTP